MGARDQPSYEQLVCLVAEQAALIGQRDATIAARAALIERLAGQVEWLAARVEVLERQVGKDSGTSSRPPSSDSPFTKAPQRSSRTSSGRPRGKQPGELGQTRNMVTDPDEIVVVDPPACTGCGGSLADAPVFATRRHQVFDVPPLPPRPYVTEYRIVARVCRAVRRPAPGRPQWG